MAVKPPDTDAYIAALPEAVRGIAEEVRQAIRSAAPDATEAIKYGMPAFQITDRSFLYMAIWKKHVGLYPIYRGDGAFEAEVGPYRAKTDTVQFMLDKPVPLDLIARIAQAQRASAR